METKRIGEDSDSVGLTTTLRNMSVKDLSSTGGSGSGIE